MSDTPLKDRITEDMKSAMRARDKARLTTLRFLLATIKQKEVDTRTTLDDTAVMAVIEKLAKQRRDAIEQFKSGGRDDLVQKDTEELQRLTDYLPAQMTDDELTALVEQCIEQSGAQSMKDMGNVMAAVKPLAQGRADMVKVSTLVKAKLSG